MPNFQGTKEIILQPYDEVTREFEVTICSAAGANDGMLAYGDGIDSVAVKAHSEDGVDTTTEMIASSSETGNIVSAKIKYPAVSGVGIYHLTFEIDTDNGDKKEMDFNRITAVDL